MKCYDLHYSKCYTSKELSAIRLEYLIKTFQLASMNGTHILGKEFVESCQVFRENEKAMILVCPIFFRPNKIKTDQNLGE